MEIRLAKIEDFRIFNEMYKYTFYEDNSCELQPMLKEQYVKLVEDECIYFAIQNGKVMGFAQIYAFQDGEAFISLMYIKEKNKGYGTMFYNLIENEIRESGLNRICIHVFDERPERFWERQGFRSVRCTEKIIKELK